MGRITIWNIVFYHILFFCLEGAHFYYPLAFDPVNKEENQKTKEHVDLQTAQKT